MSTKLSKREHTIRIGGVLMLLSPLFNLLVSISLSSGIPNKWHWSGLKMILSHVPTANWILYVSSFAIGSMMIKGRRSSWAFVLIVLAGYIMYSALTLYADIRSGNVQSILATLVNCGLFVLVYMQEFHQQVYGFVEENVKMPAMPKIKMPTREGFTPAPGTKTKPLFGLPASQPKISSAPPRAESTQSPITNLKGDVAPVFPISPTTKHEKTVSLNLPLNVDFTGQGTWAQLISVTATELRMKRTSQTLPDGLHYRTVELHLPTYPEAVVVHARLFSNNGSDYIFKIVHTHSTAKAA